MRAAGGLRRALAGAVGLGIALRFLALRMYGPEYDAFGYAVDASEGLGELWTGLPRGNLPRTPVYSTLVWAFGRWTGGLDAALDAAAFTSSVLTIAVVYVTTRDLWGERAAAWTTVLVSLDPVLLFLTGYRYSENLALAFFVAILWSIVRSLRQPPFILLAGAGAALGYLARSSLGPFFLLAGFMGLAWRLKYGRTKGGGRFSALNRYYLAAAALFLGTVVLWNLHNFLLAGRFTANATVGHAAAAALDEPLLFGAMLAIKVAFLGLIWWAYAGYFAPALRASLRRARTDELESGLWVAVLSILLTGAVLAAAFILVERTPLLWFDNVRYAAFATVPLAWIVFRNGTGSAAPSTRASVASGLGALVLTAASRAWTLCVGAGQALVGFPGVRPAVVLATLMGLASLGPGLLLGPVTSHPARVDATAAVGDAAADGDTVRVLGDASGHAGRSLVITQDLVRLHAPQVRWAMGNESADWLLSFGPVREAGYVLHSMHRDADGAVGALLDRASLLGTRNAVVYVYQRAAA